MPTADLPIWTDQTVGDTTRMNRHGVVSGTGAYLATLDLTKYKLLHCTQTGSGFTLDHVYLCESDGSGTIDLTAIQAHDHTTSSTGGGDYIDVLTANYSVIDRLWGFSDLYIDQWIESVSGTGSTSQITNHADFVDQRVIRLETGATSASTSSRRMGGLAPLYTGQVAFQALVDISDTTSIAAKWGIGVEAASAADDNNRKIGFVICTSVNGNWHARSANGTTRSDSDMGVAFTTNIQSISAFKIEGAAIYYYINGTDELEKTADIPTTSSGDGTNVFRVTVKNNTAANRIIDLAKLRLTYHSSYNNWN